MKKQNFTNLFNNVLRRGSGVNRYLFRYAAMVVVLCVLGIGEMWADSYYNYFAYYAKVNAKTATESSGRGMVYVSTSSASTSSATSESSTATGQDPTTNYSSAPTSGGAVTFYLYAKPKDGYKFDGWSTSSTRPSIFESTSASWQTTFPAGYGTSTSTSGSSSQTNNYKSDGSDSDQYYSVTATHNVYAYFSERIMVFDVSFAQPTNGTITVNGVAPSSWPYAAHTTTGSLSCTMTATPSAGYIFYGYYVLNSDNSKNYLSRTASTTLTLEEAKTVYAEFIPDTWAIFQLGADTYYDLNLANAKAVAAGGGTIVQIKDGTMPVGNYTISNNVKLLIPFSTATSIQTLPKVVTTAATLSVFRKLVLAEGINITVASGGVICVGGQIMSAGGGKPSAYPTGACGMIDMSAGGHIELNNGAVLYAWGFIKGQDKDQGNNTTGVGTITANSGATVWEMFAVGDWRGGTACSTIYNNRNSWKFFPFQSYTIQNVEVPTTYKYGSTLSNYTNVYGGGGTNPGQFAIIGNTNTLFLLKDAASLVRKWYDPTTDLVCYEMSGTTQLDALNVDVEIITVSSKDYNLPLSSSMHVILTNCNTTISRPMIVQAGAVVEVKPDASLTLSSNVYLFDKDQWGQYCYNKYFYSMTNLTIHKDRGTTNAGLDDAKLKVNGIVNVTGQIYSTTSGGDIMGDGDGTITFSSLPSATNIVMCTGVSDNENVAVASANLHNEDDSYTKSVASTTFQNINGRWFTQAAATANKADHTYDFTYISSGAVSGSGGNNTTTDAVYSWDKTGLELRQKWFNVTADCNESGHYWWHGQGDQSGWFYNWTLNSDWHQFMPTATAGLYSGSNNTLYTKTSCTWEELGSTDVNCLYEIGGVKKALVDGQFVALEANNNDPAYHEAEDPTKYYICFEGCNWHAADKYTEAEKAYIIEPDTFVWYNNAWMSVNFKEPFAYTIDETNVPVYYEYVDGEWVLAEPYVRVVDGLEDRSYWFLDEAFKFASSVLRTAPTITILRDISGITTAVSYTGANKTCTLDLNGHSITGSVSSMITVNAAGCTFNIEDNTTEKNGKINLVFSANNSRRYALNVKNGHVKLKSGTISGTCTLAYNKTSAPKPLTGCVVVAAGKQFTMDGGKVEAISAYNPIAIFGSEGAPTITINDGIINSTAETIDSPYGIQSYGTINFNRGTINATAEKSTTAVGVYVHASTKAQGTLNMTGGTINAVSYTKNSRGVIVNRALAYDTNEPRNITTFYLATANISGGEINAINSTSTDAEGVQTLGTTTITGGEINAQCSANTTAFGVRMYGGETTISGSAVINATATTTVYGIRVSEEAPTTAGVVYNSTLQMNGGTINALATTGGTVYGIYVGGATLANSTTNATNSKSYAGNYASAGTATITSGSVNASAHTNTAYGVFVEAAQTQSGAEGYAAATATPKCTINGGYLAASATAPVASVKPAGATVLTDNLKINGGYYSHEDNLETYAAPKHAVALASDDANYDPYFYKVAEAYQVAFKNGDDVLQSTYQEIGKKPVYNGETPTKTSSASTSYLFDGWTIAADGTGTVYTNATIPNVTSAGATYYAHYEETDLRYIVTLDVTTNGGSCATDKIYVVPTEAIGILPDATKDGYTFKGWFTAASGGTMITTSAVPTEDVTYYAQFTVNNYTLTWVLDGGKVGTAGKYGSTSWPAKNATGTQTKAVPYGSTLTAPVVARTGYTFGGWSPTVASAMPSEEATYKALWNPNTNTAYTVKHYLQNVEGSYPADPYETEAFTGTTATSVTPAVKSYEGFISPSAQTATIAADGKTVVTYQYARRHYIFTLDAATNGGTSEVPSIEVIHGATIGAVPPDAQKGCNNFTGWYTKAEGGVKITSSFVIEYDMKKLYAQFSDDVRIYPITYLPGANGTGSVAAGTKTCGETATITSSTFTSENYSQIGWSLTDGGEQAYAFGGTYTENAALTLYPVWAVASVTVGGATTYYKTIDAAWEFVNSQTTDTELKLLGNATATASLVFAPAAAMTCTLDLNNHTLSGAVNSLINVNLAGSTFIITDESGDKKGKITTTLSTNARLNCVCLTAGTLKLEKGAIYSNNPHTYSSSSSNKNSAATGVYVATGGVFTMDDGTIESTSQYSSYGLLIAQSTTSEVTINGGLIKGQTNASTTAGGIYNYSTKLTVNGGHIIGHAWTTTSYGINLLGKATINGGIIEATNDTTNSKGTTTVYGIYAQYKSSTYKGVITIPSASTVQVLAKARTNTAYAVCISSSSSTGHTIAGGTFTAIAKTGKTAGGVFTYGPITISGGTFNVSTGTTAAYGIYTRASTTTVNGNPTFNVTSGSTDAYGAFAYGYVNAKGGGKASGTININGGTFNVTSGSTTAYGAYAGLYGLNIVQKGTVVNDTVFGQHYMPGIISVTNGTFNIKATNTDAFGIVVTKHKAESGAVGTTTRYPKATIKGGKYKVESVSDGNATAYAMNASASASYQLIQGGQYNTKRTNASTTSVVEDKYTAPTKSCNFHVLDLPESELPYKYEVAEAYNVTFNVNGHGTAPEAQLIKKNGTVSEPATLSATGYTFGGWYKEEGCTNAWNFSTDKVTTATTLHAKWTPIQYTISFDSNGGSEVASITQDYNTSVEAPANPTKTGYTFNGWSPAVPGVMPASNIECVAQWTINQYTISFDSDGGSEVASITQDYNSSVAAPANPTKTGYTFTGWTPAVPETMPAENTTCVAQWTVNTHALTWNFNGGTPSGSYTEAGDAIAYGTAIEYPTVAKTGYTFAGWSSSATAMPDEDLTITASWTPNTNTPYVVKHYQQNIADDDYTEVTADRQELTGATDAQVTPAVNSYTGFTAPDAQTVTILADGSRVVEYYYTRDSYTLTWNANGGELSGSYTSGSVKFGTPITAPTATRTTYDFDGWFDGTSIVTPAVTMPAENKTYTAQWTLAAVTILWKSEDGTDIIETDDLVLIGSTPSFDSAEPSKATTEAYTYTFDGWTTEANGGGTFYAIGELPAVSAAATYYAHFTTTANVASVTVSGATTYYTTIDAAFAHVNTVSTNMTITLLADATAAASLVYQPKSTYTCTLDLNNHTISGAINKLIDINLAKSTFIITDNSVAKGGSVSTTLSTNARLYSVFLTAGTLKLQNGKIYANNPYKYSSGKSCAATGVYVTAGQTFTMENGTVESASQYASYAIYIAKSTKSVVTINGGLIKGRTTASTTAAGIYNYCTNLTINGGHIIGHAYTTTAYGVYLYGGSATINGGTIEATNDTTNNKGTTTTYGINVAYVNSTYKGVLTIPSTSTVNVFAKARTTTSYAIVVGGGSTGNTIAGGTYTAKTKTGKTAYCVNSSGNITISGGTFTAYAATTNAYGLYSARGTITVNGDPTFNVTAGSTTAYGALAYGTIGKKGTGKYSGTIEINGGTFNVTSTAETAWGAYAGLASRDLRSCSATNDTVPGLHYMPGILVVNDGTFNVKATTTGAFGIVVAKAKSESGTVGTTARIPLGTVTGGKFKVESMGDANATAYAMNSATTAARLVVQGGYYNTKRTDASEISNIEDKYTAPTLSNNYRVLDLPEEELPYKYKVAEAYNLTWDAAGGELSGLYTSGYTAVGDPITAPTATRTDYDFSGWNESPAATMPASDKTYMATWTFAETGDYLDIVDWTSNGDGTGTLTINANGWAASGWPNTINGTSYAKGDRAADRTLTIPYEGAAGTNLQIKVESGGSTTSLHNYKIPYINTTEGAGEEDIVYVNSGTLKIDALTTPSLAALYVRPEASVEVTKGTLTVGKLVMRTLPWQAAAISGNFTTSETYYTRIAPNKRTISGPDADLTYESASYYQFALPLSSTVALKDIKVSHGANTPYGNTWLLKYYDEANRAANGPGGSNWVALEEDDYIQGGVGYEMSSNSNYYREFYFPVGAVNSEELGVKTAVSYHSGAAGVDHAGWNIICSPLMSVYNNAGAHPIDGLKISKLMTDGSYDQDVHETVEPAIPFSYQATSSGFLYFEEGGLAQKLSAPRRMSSEDEQIETEWIRVSVLDDDGRGDHTSIFVHPNRFEPTYETGIDVAKQSFTASRALIYSSHAYGEMAFAGVADSLLEKGVALTIYSPSAQSLTISMRENNWLNRMEYVWLIDTETGIRTDLLTDEYSFYATEGTTAGRFFIKGVFAPKVTTDIQNDGMMNDESRMARKLLIDDKIYIDVNGRRYDATGKLVNDK